MFPSIAFCNEPQGGMHVYRPQEEDCHALTLSAIPTQTRFMKMTRGHISEAIAMSDTCLYYTQLAGPVQR
ncbi:UNVERIFIED_CONTAM: hypothetical protein NY603_26675, partial [Bacteroidetes bacterium 56_B9]